MADPIIRLRVESQEYDSKIKRATDGLLAFEQSCHKAQKSMADADKATVDFVREMGKMETVNKTAKGSVNELTKAYTELSAQYNRLTEDEKKSPFGQAMSKSIEDLKGRIQQGRQELDNINRSLNDTGKQGGQTSSILDGLAGKFGLNTSQLMKFGGALGIAKTALDVAKDAFFSNESQVDEWGRTVEAGESVYRAFVNALNNFNFSGFFSRIDGIIQKAREAYDAMDRLNTVMTIINPERAKLQARQQQLRETIRREGKDSAAGKQAQQELINLEPKLKASYRTEAGLNYNAFDNLVRERLAEGGIKLDDKSYKFLMSTFSDENAFRKLEQSARGSRQYVPGQSFTTSWGASYNSGRWVDTRNTNKKLLDLFTDEWRQKNSPYLTAAFGAIGSAASVGLQNTRYVTGGGGGGGGGRVGRGRGRGVGGGTVTEIPKTEQQINSEKIRELNQEYVTATEQRKAAIRSEIKILQIRNEEIQRLIDESNGKIAEDTSSFNLKNIQAWISGIKKKLNEAELGTEVYDRLTAQLSDATALSNLLGAFINKGLSMTDIDAKPIWEKILSGKDIPAEELQTILDSLNTKLAELHLAPLKLDIEGNVSTDTSLFSQKNIQDLISTTKQQLEQSQIGSDFYNALTAKLYDATALSSLLGEFVKNGIDFAEVDPSAMWSKIFGGEDVATEELQKMLDVLNAYLAEHGLDLMKLNTDGSLSNVESKKGGNKFDEGLDKVSKGMSGLSTIISGLQQTGVKIPSGIQDAVGVMQGVISVVQGVQAVISLFSSTTETANTAALIANTAAVGTLTTVMAANTAMSFMPFLRFGGIAHAANGLVAGHDFSDNVPVMVSSGELILNRAQQGNLAQQLDGGSVFDNLHLETSVRAEEIRIMLNSNSMRRGRGEYVTTKRQR